MPVYAVITPQRWRVSRPRQKPIRVIPGRNWKLLERFAASAA